MKNKRTKLTAVVLSVLMAVSTISSVTWADDLFSDGSEAAGTVITPSGVASEGEAIVVEESENIEEDLLNATASVDYVEVTDAQMDRITRSPDGTYYNVPVNFYYKDGTGPVEDIVKATPTGEIKPADCLYPQRIELEIKIDNTNIYVKGIWYKQEDNWDAETLHTNTPKYLTGSFLGEHDFVDATCEKAGHGIKYIYCTNCHRCYNFSTKEYGSVLDSTLSSITSYDDTISGIYKDYFQEETILSLGHHEGGIQKDVVPPADTPYNDLINEGYTFDPNTDDKSKNDTSKVKLNVRTHFENLANCVKDLSTGTFSGKTSQSNDVYYYEFTQCVECGKTLSIYRHTLYSADITEGKKYYKAGTNVWGFVDKNGDPKQDVIPESDFDGVILYDCEVGGEYYLGVSSKDADGIDFSIVETKTVKGGHTWDPTPGIIEVDKNGLPITDSKGNNTYKYLNPKSLKYENNDWVASSINCVTPAYYIIVQHCLNPFCKYREVLNNSNKDIGSSNPDLAGIREAKRGGHEWYTENDTLNGKPRRYVDPAETTYKYVDENHHLEHYKDLVECKYCGHKEHQDSNKPDALVAHTFAPKEIKGSRVEPKCGVTGSVERVEACVCLKDLNDPESYYYDESTKSTVTIPATDKHDFGTNPAFIKWSGGSDDDGDGIGDGNGAVYIADKYVAGVSLHADIVRECTICGNLDSNGINTMLPTIYNRGNTEISSEFNREDELDPDHFNATTLVPAGKWCADLIVSNFEPAAKDPNTGINYRCSTAHATISVEWKGTVDGVFTSLSDSKDNVPYYASIYEYQARTAHTPGKPQKEGDRIITRCTVCGDIVSNDPDTTPDVGVPTVSATSFDFDTVNVSWTKVEGATAYRLYFRSSDEGISKWQKIRAFSSDITSYPVNGLTTGSKYRFTVRAELTQDGKTTLGDYSRKGAVAVPKLTTPEVKSVTASGKITKVTWSRVDGASGYIVFRNSQRVGTVTKGSKVTWTDKKPVNGAKYQVRAYRTEDKKNFKSDLSEPK